MARKVAALDEDATRRESERNYFAGTDIERITLVLRSSGLRCAAFAGTDIHDSARLCKTRLTLNCGCALRTALLNIARDRATRLTLNRGCALRTVLLNIARDRATLQNATDTEATQDTRRK